MFVIHIRFAYGIVSATFSKFVEEKKNRDVHCTTLLSSDSNANTVSFNNAVEVTKTNCYCILTRHGVSIWILSVNITTAFSLWIHWVWEILDRIFGTGFLLSIKLLKNPTSKFRSRNSDTNELLWKKTKLVWKTKLSCSIPSIVPAMPCITLKKDEPGIHDSFSHQFAFVLGRGIERAIEERNTSSSFFFLWPQCLWESYFTNGFWNLNIGPFRTRLWAGLGSLMHLCNWNICTDLICIHSYAIA